MYSLVNEDILTRIESKPLITGMSLYWVYAIFLIQKYKDVAISVLACDVFIILI